MFRLNFVAWVVMVGVMVLANGAQAVDQATPIDLANTQGSWTDLSEYAGILGWDDADSSVIGGGGDHFDQALGIRVGGAAYGQGDGMLDVTGNTVTADTLGLAGLNVTVQYQISDNYPVMRQLIMLQNPTGSAVNTTLDWINNTGNDSGQVVIYSTSGDLLFANNDMTLVTADDSDVDSNDTEANVWAIYGAGAGATPNATSLLDGENADDEFGDSDEDGVRVGFNILVPANATRYMLFFVGSPQGNPEALTLANLFDTADATLLADLLMGITSQQQQMILNWAPVPDLAAVAGNGNQGAVGGALNNAFSMGMGSSLAGTLAGLGTSGQQQLLQNLVPQARLGLTGARFVSQQKHNSVLVGRMDRGRTNISRAEDGRSALPNAALASLNNDATGDAMADTNPPAGSYKYSFWMQTSHFFGDVNSDSNAAGYRYRTHGGAIGVDRRYGQNMIVGAGIFANVTDINGRDGSGEADATTVGINFYGSYFQDDWHVDGGLGYSAGFNDTDRPTGIGSTAKGDYTSHAFNAFVLGGYGFTPFDDQSWQVEPQAGLDYTMIHDGSYTETGAGPLNLSVDAETSYSLRSVLGLQLSKAFEVDGLGKFNSSISAGWRYELLDQEVNASASVLGSSFSVSGVERSRHSADIRLRFDWQARDNAVVYVEYAPEFADGWNEHAVTLGLRLSY